MVIEQLFQEDINRKINGVVKVDQDATDVLVQELDEYVITRDLKKHFITFFNNYGESFHEGTADIGVWISGFFGSGKSHFLKMLSYLLANQEVQGVRTVERFRKKFEDDPATFMLIDSVTKGHTDTILFNIDIEGSINKDKTAVLRVFAKMFYNHLGFYGENLKVAKLEQFIEKRGMTAEFRRVFEEKNGGPWLESRDAFAFFEDDVVDTLKEVLGMSEDAARNWFNGTETVETSIAQLVSEMKDYVDNKTDDFRLLFMEKVLCYFRDRDGFAKFKTPELKDYEKFKGTLIDFRSFYGLDQYNLKEIDKYMWQLGKAYFPKNYGKKKMQEEQK